MKKTSVLLLLVAVLFSLFGFSAAALADNSSSNKITIKGSEVKGWTQEDFNDLTIFASGQSASYKEKDIYIDMDAYNYIVEKGYYLRVKTPTLILAFYPSMFNTTELTQAKATGSNVTLLLALDEGFYFDPWRITAKNNMSGYQAIGNYGLNMEAWILLDGAKTYQLKNLSKPVKVEYEYTWQNYYTTYNEASISFYWIDYDTALATENGKWSKVAGTADTVNDVVSANLSSGYGAYMLFAAPKSTSSATTTTTNTASSLSGHWAQAAIEAMQEKKIVPEDLSSVNLNAAITREEFTSYLVKTLKLPTNVSLDGQFTDIASSGYHNAILTAAYYGLVKGQTDTTFAPKAYIQRQEMAVMLNRALAYAEKTTDNSTSSLSAAMTDYSKISSWAQEGCAVVYNNGLMSGRENNQFAPNGNTTWAEAVVILYRFSQL